MKKLSLSLPLLAVLCGLVAFPARSRASTPERPELVEHVESCEAILREFMAVPATAIPPEVWHGAKAVLILNQFKVGFLFGFKGGYGVLMVKKADGHWSLPVLVSADEGSFGLQAGAKSVETVCIFNDEATPRMLFSSRFSIGVDARAVAGPHAAEIERNGKEYFSAPVLVYSHSEGLFAGATVKAGRVGRDDADNFVLYSTGYAMPELLYSDWVQPPEEVQPLMGFVQQLAP